MDLFITGSSGFAPGKMFYNNGDNTFTMSATFPVEGLARTGGNSLVDIDRDGNLDYSCIGYGNGKYRNVVGFNTLTDATDAPIPSNTAPSVPANLKVAYADGKFTLTWDESTDKETPQAALRYNVYAKNIGTDAIFAYAPVDIETGVLKIGGAIVPLLSTNSITLTMDDGKYTFGVQAVDQADLASKFATFDYNPTGISANVPNNNAVRAFVSDRDIVIENNMSTASSYSIIAPTGQIIATGVCPAGSKQTVSGLAQGVYIVKTTGNVNKLLVF